MTDREILEYSKQIIDGKKEIENSDTAAPDLDDQVRNKFAEDTVNRARFIDSTLVIGGATKEFRNIFGVDAPHYELSDECYFAIDNNIDNEYSEKEKIEIADPMNNNEKSRYFIDCWEVINAAKFDSDCTIRDFPGGSEKVPAERQNFFVDSKKRDKGSPAHNPICPPGYDKWAGKAVYKYICKNFDLTETAIYNMLLDPKHNTLPYDHDEYFESGDKFSYNIDPNGRITKNSFIYNYVDKNGNPSDEYMMKAYQDPDFKLPEEGCDPDDKHPIKWFTVNIPVRNSYNGSKYTYSYDWSNSLFKYCKMPICSFKMAPAFKNKSEILNRGYAILSVDPEQLAELPSSGDKTKTYEQIRFCIHIIYEENHTDNNGGPEYEGNNFVMKMIKNEFLHSFTVRFSPISSSSLPNAIKEKFANFVNNMEKDCLFYYNLADKRKIKLDVPDLKNSKEKIEAVIKACEDFITAYNNGTRYLTTVWNKFMNALKDRVLYTIYGTVPNFSETEQYKIGDPVIRNSTPYYCIEDTYGPWDNNKWAYIFDNTRVVTGHETTIQYNGSQKIITRWDNKILPSWPSFLRRVFKNLSTPVYENLDSITVTSETVYRNINYTTKRDEEVTITKYLFPESKDVTSSGGNPISVKNFYNNVLTEADRAYLKSKGVIVGNKIYIGGKEKDIDSDELMEVIYQVSETERPPYDNIKRAQELDTYLSTNPSLYKNAFITLSDRINKRTGTLRNLCTILESTNINYQMIEQRKRNIANLFSYINAYEITGGFGSNIATIKLAAWEPYTSAYSNLERMGTVYLLADTTKIQFKDAEGNPTDSFINGTYVKTTITEIIDMISDTSYNYEITTDNYVVPNKIYYIYNEQLAEYQEAKESELTDDNINNLYERTVSSGPIFNVTLQDKIPENFKGRNPRLVKMY